MRKCEYNTHRAKHKSEWMHSLHVQSVHAQVIDKKMQRVHVDPKLGFLIQICKMHIIALHSRLPR